LFSIAEIAIKVGSIGVEESALAMVLTICKCSFINLFIIWINFTYFGFDPKSPLNIFLSEAVIAIVFLFIFSLSEFLISAIVTFIKSSFFWKIG